MIVARSGGYCCVCCCALCVVFVAVCILPPHVWVGARSKYRHPPRVYFSRKSGDGGRGGGGGRSLIFHFSPHAHVRVHAPSNVPPPDGRLPPPPRSFFAQYRGGGGVS